MFLFNSQLDLSSPPLRGNRLRWTQEIPLVFTLSRSITNHHLFTDESADYLIQIKDIVLVTLTLIRSLHWTITCVRHHLPPPPGVTNFEKYFTAPSTRGILQLNFQLSSVWPTEVDCQYESIVFQNHDLPSAPNFNQICSAVVNL
jgi:hypothetical protein